MTAGGDFKSILAKLETALLITLEELKQPETDAEKCKSLLHGIRYILDEITFAISQVPEYIREQMIARVMKLQKLLNWYFIALSSCNDHTDTSLQGILAIKTIPENLNV